MRLAQINMLITCLVKKQFPVNQSFADLPNTKHNLVRLRTLTLLLQLSILKSGSRWRTNTISMQNWVIFSAWHPRCWDGALSTVILFDLESSTFNFLCRLKGLQMINSNYVDCEWFVGGRLSRVFSRSNLVGHSDDALSKFQRFGFGKRIV